MKNAFGFFAAAAAAVAACTAYAKTGESWKSAGSISAGKSKTVVLVAEKDLDDGSYWDDGVYYLSFSCSRYQAYTVYTTGVTDESGIDMSVDDISSYKDYGDKDPPYLPSFSGSMDRDGNIRYILYAADWDEDCAKSGTYYIRLTGDIGRSVTVTLVKGEEEERVVYGTAENPAPLTVGSGSKSGSLIDGSYYFAATLSAGKKYTFWTEGGTEDSALKLDVAGDSEADVDDPETRDMTGVDENNQGMIVVPAATGRHIIAVDGDESARFTLNYGEVAARLPNKHAVAASITKDMLAQGFSDAECEPGYRNDPDSGFFDQVIDQTLYKATLEKGKCYAFAAEGAAGPLAMELYDAGGKVLLSSSGGTTTGAFDCRMTFACDKAGDYWIGVCEKLDDEEVDQPSGLTATFTAKTVAPGVDGLADGWDAEDDTYAGATGLAPGLDAFSQHGPHTFGAADLADWFRIDARNGLTYELKAAMDASSPLYNARMAEFPLKGTIYTLNGTALRKFDEIEDLKQGGSFAAKANVSYYIAVSVEGAQGQDFGPYMLESKATGAGGLGSLAVDIGGVTFAEGSSWQIVAKGAAEPKYPGGASVFLTPGEYSITFAKVAGWTQPADMKVKVAAGAATSVQAKYSDTCDVPGKDATDGDGAMSAKKTTALKPSSKEASVSRSLWSGDEADWFKVPVAASTYYRFALAQSQKLGDAEIEIYRENGKDLVARGRDVEFMCREPKANYYVRVAHSTPEKADAQYSMKYSSKAVGAVSFKGDVSVKDGAYSAVLAAKRQGGKEGRVRVRYSTFAGTARPGVDYEPQSGYLEWDENDTKDKTVEIVLIPGLVAKWREDVAFTVKMAAVPQEDREAGESVPALGTPATATVTIGSAAKKNTGTVSLLGYGAACTGFDAPKKPSLTMRAGENMEIWFERSGGSDGKVAVAVSPAKGTALADVHFDASAGTLAWEDGETGPKAFILRTYPPEEPFMSAKTLTVKAAADKTAASDAAKISAAAVTVVLTDPRVASTIEPYAASFPKNGGVSVKAGKSDAWYFDDAGNLSSALLADGGKADISLTLAGPGRFTCAPVFNAPAGTKSVCTMTIGKETITLAPGVETPVKRYLPKGSTTVKIAIARANSKQLKGYAVDDAEVSVSFADTGDGPFGWKPLPAPSLVMPLAGEVSVSGSACTCVDPEEIDKVKLAWSDGDDPEIVYLLTLDSDKKNLGTAKALFAGESVSGGKMLVPVYCSDCTAKPIPGELASGQLYYWRVDTTFADPACGVTNVNAAVWEIRPIECEGNPYAAVAGGMDAYGRGIAGIEKSGSAIPVALVQGVAAYIPLAGRKESCGEIETLDGATFALVKGSSLPAGLSLKDGAIVGVPSKAGACTAIVQTSWKEPGAKVATAGGTVTLAFEVSPPGLAEGTFNGLVATDDERLAESDAGVLPPEARFRIGSVNVTAGANGKITAKVAAGGSTWSFSANGWAGTEVLENGTLAVWTEATNVLKLAIAKTAERPAYTVDVPAVLRLVAPCGDPSDRQACDTPMSVSIDLSFLSDGKTSVYTNVLYAGEAYRDNRKLATTAEDFAPFAGYYTISLAPHDPVDYKTGYGYLTLTIDAKGGAKVAGVLSDGATKPSAAAAAYVSESPADGNPAVYVPVYFAKGKASFGGTIAIKAGPDGVPVVASSSRVLWIDADPASTYEGVQGFSMEIEPVGGYYNTLYNLQAYYTGWSLGVKAVDVDSDLPEEVLGNNEAYVCWPGMMSDDSEGLFGEYLKIAGNTISAAKQSLAYREAAAGGKKTKLADWSRSVNPANLSFSFKQATGLYSGKFDVYAGNAFDDDDLETRQAKLGSYSHQGVLLMARDDETGILPFEDAVMPGFYLVPVTKTDETEKTVGGKTVTVRTTRKFTASLPFVIGPEERIEEWEAFDWVEELP